MKNFAIAALIAAVTARFPDNEMLQIEGGPVFEPIAKLFKDDETHGKLPPSVGLGHQYVPWTREDYDNAKELWNQDWARYRSAHPNDQDCSISESDNWKGAQQCAQSWECRGARMCERGGWCSGYDGCEGTPLPDQAPGLATDC